jgi:hypothetical protein
MDVCETFCDGLRDLSPPVFARYIDASTSSLTAAGQCLVLRNILRHYLPNAAPDPQRIDPETAADDGLSVLMLEKCYLPFAANTVILDTNTKMSLVLENLFRLSWDEGMTWSTSLQEAVEKGVEARNGRVKRKTARAKSDGEETVMRGILSSSGQRLLIMMRLIKFDGGESDDSE